MNSRRQTPTRRTRAREALRADRDQRPVADIDRVIGQKPARDQRCGSNRLHGIDSPVKPMSSGASTPSKVSQSQDCTPKHIEAKSIIAVPAKFYRLNANRLRS